ncbi:SDR family NAD(P)-dependent oxidoreductase [Bosea sp. (in: a-proteobacteria)]|uniref:SDR family NAD(P)-dependent oxidoreductase n=1 Tax=Bosea sp. (in: a-proteobacteria) TaxID=1871050 RepID=UPI00260886D1|nr:SDR family NAD(P)-dependent oxidoreductase [Bosea sp. (in: a-proteobacteria)]MCO5092150.1 SDR family oxidoreductase [Bosea sp. (in: a-proteobacteria)]
MRFRGKVAIVTGAGSGIGRLAAQRFAAEGAQVVAADIDEARAKETAAMIVGEGGRAAPSRTDVTKSADVKAMIDLGIERFGQVDILYNHAGITRQASVCDLSEEDWDLVLATNLKSVFLGCKHVLPHMVARGQGVIVNTGGTFGFYARPEYPAYCAAKAGVHNLTKQIALDYSRHGIRINAVCPGFIDTPINASIPPEAIARIVATQPLGRPGKAEEVVAAALFLASDEASFITGTTLLVDGGQLSGRHGC